jgi:hypothetical protein
VSPVAGGTILGGVLVGSGATTVAVALQAEVAHRISHRMVNTSGVMAEIASDNKQLLAVVIPACVVTVGSVAVAWVTSRRDVKRLTDQNDSQHGASRQVLELIHAEVHRVSSRVDTLVESVGRLEDRAETNGERLDRLESWRINQQGDHK